MSSTPNYDFFNYIDKFITEVKKIESLIPENTPHEDCYNFSQQHKLGNIEKSKILCIRFAILNNLLVTIKSKVKNYCDFLNYWLNYELSQPWFSEDYSTDFIFNGLESQLESKPGYNSLCSTIDNINKNELIKMNILYNLYEKYSEINSIIVAKSENKKQKLLTLSAECCGIFNYVSYMCNDDNRNNNRKFCDKLEALKSKYNELDNKVVGDGYDFSDYFIELSKCPNTKIITTAVTGTVVGLIPLLGVLYKVSELNIKL
ncbi:hypothetical protein PVMG_01429 [Plasmodium vivax Mauritania I]|uniref:PIR Superfamily Protein n=1 Tax=Plasmodium vivax Mauritania I TaxID=1035515 RepID=A0A0J9VYY0_PLAVI|nr:hypothetical protein PVMG_01429 [Plasmodium vivax Mauritania I]